MSAKLPRRRSLASLYGRLRVELPRVRWYLAALILAGAVTAFSAKLLLDKSLQSYSQTIMVSVPDAKGVVAGQNDVRWAGISVGVIDNVTLEATGPVLEVKLNPPKDSVLYRDATVELRPQTGLNDMYLNIISRGHRSAGVLDRREPLAAARAHTPVNIADVLNVFSESTRDRMRELVDQLGYGLKDHGSDLRWAFSAATPWLKSVQRLSGVLARRRLVAADLVHNLRLLTDELGNRDSALRSIVTNGSTTFAALARERDALGSLIRELPSTLTQLRRSSDRLTATADVLQPSLVALTPATRRLPSGLDAVRRFSQTALPALRGLQSPLRRLAPFAKDLRPAARALAGALGQLAPQVPRLESVAKDVTPCERFIEAFFVNTLSTFKWANRSTHSGGPRGELIINGAESGVTPVQMLRNCANGKPAE
jgi:ABC-type transporter Mla subunit MlaD